MTSDRSTSELVLTWLRRFTSLAVNSALGAWLYLGSVPVPRLLPRLDAYLEQLTGIPPDRAHVALLVLWYVLLSGLKVPWLLLLPVYLVFWPWWLLAATAFNFTARPVLRRLGFFREFEGPTPASTGRVRSILWLSWLILLVLWLAAFRGLRAQWAIWIPPMLVLPLWWFALRSAYKAAVSPRLFVTLVTHTTDAWLDYQMKQFQKAVDSRKRPSSNEVFYQGIKGVLDRYPDDRLIPIIQRQALIYFSLTLVAALAASSVFWGLIGYVALQTDRPSMLSYAFFSAGTLPEAVVWAWGCMTTTINFPGDGSPLWLKSLHSAILATGLFQLTYLIASFSVLVGTDTHQRVSSVAIALQKTRGKLEVVKNLERELLKPSAAGTWPEQK